MTAACDAIPDIRGSRTPFTLYVGNRHEQRFKVRQARDLPACAELPAEDFVIFDEREQTVGRLSDRWPEEITGTDEPLWPELERDRWPDLTVFYLGALAAQPGIPYSDTYGTPET